MLCNILEIQSVLTSTVVDYAIKLCIVFLILYIKSSPNPTSKLLHFFIRWFLNFSLAAVTTSAFQILKELTSLKRGNRGGVKESPLGNYHLKK